MKKFFILIILLFIVGCFDTEDKDTLEIYTGPYPIEFATRHLYGHNSTVRSIYPDDINIYEYELTEKQIEDFSESDIFIFNSLSNEKEYVIPMFLNNQNFRIIDATKTITYQYQMEEIWLDPSNYLKIIKNIQDGLLEEIPNHYLQTEIINNYEELRSEVSNISAQLRKINQQADNTTIVIGNNAFVFLEKYGFNILSLEENEDLTDRRIQDVIDLIDEGIVKYIFISKFEKANETIANIVEEHDIKIVKLHTLKTITEEERNNDENYLTIMKENIEKLKQQLFND